ncbi:MAG: hypothetical protein LQ339_001956 [Xanthoria mediterranea]|nr:MAG: hypothetical protein LQ339_001956 [Xanthoria mediterranea]
MATPPPPPATGPSSNQPSTASPLSSIASPTIPPPLPNPPSNQPPPPRSVVHPTRSAQAPSEPTRRSKRQRQQSPEIIPDEEQAAPPKRQKRSNAPAAAQTAKKPPTRKAPRKKAAAPKKGQSLLELPRVAIPQDAATTPIPAPGAVQDLDGPRKEAGLSPIQWTFQSDPLYCMDVVRNSFDISIAAGMPLTENFERAGGAALVRCIRSPRDAAIAGSETQGLLPSSVGQGGAKGKGWNHVRPVVSDIWVAERGQISWDDQISLLAASTRRGALNALKPRRAAEFFRVDAVVGEGEGQEKGMEFYLWWARSDAVRVNGVEVIPPHTAGEEEEGEEGPDVAIGPLPDFAVIQVEDVVLFFWKNEAALRYSPASVEADKVRVKEVEEEEEEEERRKEKERQEAEQLDQGLLGESEEESGPPAAADQMQPQLTSDEVDQLFTSDPMQEPLIPSESVLEHNRRDEWKIIWEIIWDTGVRRNERGRAEDPTIDCQQIISYSDVSNLDLVSSIAAVWDAVASHEDGRQFAFNSDSQYSLVRGDFLNEDGKRMRSMAAVHGPNDLLIPMVMDGYSRSPPNSAGFPPGQDPNDNEKELPAMDPKNPKGDKGQVGHTVFAVAQRIKEDRIEGDQVRAIIFDSRPTGSDQTKRIEDNFGKTIRRIGWLGMDWYGRATENRDAPPRRVETLQPRVPFQVSPNSCGIHAILHAWGYMLGLPRLDSNVRLHGQRITTQWQADAEEETFITDAVRMINLAVAGHMDFRTIQAFFNHYGFCQLQDPNSSSEAQPEQRMATMMNDKILDKILDEKRDAESTTKGTEPKDNQFREDDIWQVRQVAEGMRWSEAVYYLDAANGDIDTAKQLASGN